MIDRQHSGASFCVILSLLLLFCTLLKLPTLYYPRTETDEIIYWQLAENLVHKGQYNLKDSAILTTLSPHIYDRPLFHYPPLYPALLAPFVLLKSPKYAIIVSWIGHLLCVLSVALVARHAMRKSNGSASFTSPVFWLPVLAICVDPILTFISRKLWIDGILAGLVSLSAAVLLIAGDDRHGRRLLVLSGALLGLAVLAKLTALILVPVYVYGVLAKYRTPRRVLGSLLALLVPACLLTLPWFLAFRIECGVFIPSWVKPDEWLIRHYPFVKAAMSRPWYYYAVKVFLLTPLAGVCIYQLVRERAILKDDNVKIGALWFVLFLAVLTFLSAREYGFQMRQVGPMVTAAYVVFFYACREGIERPGLCLAYALSILFGAVSGSLYLLNPQLDEIFSYFEIGGMIRF